MYEKATLADLAIVSGILLILISFFLAPFRSTNLFIYVGTGVALVAAGFVLDRVYEKRKRTVDLEVLGPKLLTYIEDAERLMASGAKALDEGRSKKAFNIYLSVKSTLELAEHVARKLNDTHHVDVILRDLTEARKGIGQAKVGIASDMSDRANELYARGKFGKALEALRESDVILTEADEYLDVDAEVRKVKENMLSCRKRIGEKELKTLMDEVSEREGYYKEYFEKGLLFDAREMLNIMEVKVQKASEIAEEFEFTAVMEEVNHALIRVREGKNMVEKAILERLKSREPGRKGITTIIDKVDPTLKKVAVDILDEIEVYSGYDFRNGAVRLQYVVKNTRSTTISQLMLRVLRDERQLNLIRVIPDYEVRFNEVNIGSIPPGEKKMVNFYFDPHICGEMTVDATLTYLDASGEVQNLVPERKTVEIPEPEIGKGENVNSSYLNSLIEKGGMIGHRSFNIPSGLNATAALSMVEEVVERMGMAQIWHHHVGRKLSSGYYGKSDGDECGIMIFQRGRSVEIRAGGTGKDTVTSLLTSISSDLRNRFEREGHRGVNVRLSIQDSVLYRTNIQLGEKIGEELEGLQEQLSEEKRVLEESSSEVSMESSEEETQI